jgi:hypothetical protein
MSYIVARKIDQEEPVAVDEGMSLPEIDFTDRDANTLDMNLDDEVLDFVVGLIKQVNSLAEGEALVVWKEIF